VKRWKYTRSASGWWVASLLGALVLGALVLGGCGDGRSLLSARRGDEGVRADGGELEAHSHAGPQTAVDAAGDTNIDSVIDAGPTSGDTATLPSDAESELSFDGEPLYSDYVRLTHLQWENSVVANLRLDAPTGHLEALAPDVRTRYTNDEAVLRVSDVLVSDYQLAAASVAQRVAADPEALTKVSASREPETFIAEVGRRFYRRPLTSAESATYLTLFERGKRLAMLAEDEFAVGAQLLLEVWMQAPSFVYRVEHSDDRLSGYEVATRLALLLTDTTPSDALLRVAESGELDTAAGVVTAAAELLTTAQATLVFRRFHDETYGLSRVADIEIDASLGAASGVAGSLVEAAHLFFDRQFREGLGLRELLLSPVAFVNADLAPFYAVPAPSADGFEAVTLGGARRGMFAQLPFLMLDSFDEVPNAFRRGAMFTNYVLCQTLSEPATVSPVVPAVDPSLTNRERSSQLVAGADCQGCHHAIDPFGFAFENFDGYGRERTEDNGSPVDTKGVYPFASNPPFADSTELMSILAESRLAHGCYSRQLTEFSLGRVLSATDAPLVAELQALSLGQNESLAGLVTALVGSETFRSSGSAQ
jgi:hypothetical protein